MFGINIKKLNPLSGRWAQERVGIDFSSGNLKLAHIRVISDKTEIVNLLSRNIAGLSDEEISKVIRNSFSELKAKNTNIINIMPSNLVIIKNIEIPSTDPAEIRGIINLQAGRHTPYSREEIIVDYIDIGIYKHSYTKILLVILVRSLANRQIEILEKAGLKLEKVALAPEGLAWFISKILKTETEGIPVNIVHIDENSTDFTIILRGKAIFIRSIPIGTQHLIEEKEKYQMKFIEELKRSLEAYQNEDIEKTPHMLILTGAIEELKDLENALRDTLHIPLRVVPYFKSLSIAEEAMRAVSVTGRLSFLNIIACLLARQELKVDLIPEEIKLKKLFEERGRDLTKTGVLLLTVFVLIFSILISKNYFKSAYLEKLNTKFQSLNQQVYEFESDFAKISLIKNYLLKRGLSLEVLTELYNILPLELELSEIRLDEQGRFTIRGTSESMPVVFSLVESMEKSKYFKNAKAKYTTKRKVGLNDFTDFEIISQIDLESIG